MTWPIYYGNKAATLKQVACCTYYRKPLRKMQNLSLHCLNENSPEATIKTLMLAKPYAKQIIAGDLTGSDNLKSFCANNQIRYVKLSVNDNMSQCHNDLISCSDMRWHMHLYPGENVENHTKIKEIIQGKTDAYRLPCVRDGWLDKEIRLYNRDLNCKFTNPVFGSVTYPPAKFLEVYVTGGEAILSPYTQPLLKTWAVKQPLSLEARYYTTLALLMEGKQAAFVAAAKNHLFLDHTQSVGNTMLRYYLACGLAGKVQTRKEAAKHIVTCLAASVLMAEFWCLLGDLCLTEGSYDKAKAMYRNAMILGSRRNKDDLWPMHIVKYKDHPETMLTACYEAAQESKTFRVKGS